MAGALVHQGVVHQLLRGGVDPVQHVGGFAGVHRPLAIRAHRHALGLHAHLDLRQHLVALGVHHRHQRIVFVGDVQPAVIGVQGELLRVGAGGQLLDELARGQVHHLHGVGVAGADVEQLVVAGQCQATGARANLEAGGDFQAVQVDDADAVVLLIGDVGRGGQRLAGEQQQGGAQGGSKGSGHGVLPSRCCQLAAVKRWQLLSGRSKPRLSSSLTGCRKPSWGDVLTRDRGCTRGMGWRSWPSQSR
ncbi:hypothetical protein D9M68_388070 [compost metagenome]